MPVLDGVGGLAQQLPKPRYSAISPSNRGTTQPALIGSASRSFPSRSWHRGRKPSKFREIFVKKSGGSSNVPANFVKSRSLILRLLFGERTKKGRRGGDLGGQKEPNGWVSGFHRIAALPSLGLGGGDRQPHLLAQGARQEPADRVGLPARGFT